MPSPGLLPVTVRLAFAGLSIQTLIDPLCPGNISLVLLRGPSTNVVPLMTIADNVANTGSYNWDVPSTLEPDTTHYGIELIVEGTGQYQYSTQCGVSSSANSSSVSINTSTTVVPATWSSSYATNGTLWTSATPSANYSAPALTATGSMTVSSSMLSTATSVVSLSNSVVPSATATFQGSPTASTISQKGAAVANVATNVGAMVMAGVIGALAL